MANQKKPPTSVRSIRLPDTLWEKLAKRAAETEMTVNALVAVGADLATTVLIHRSDLSVEEGIAKRLAEVREGPPAPKAAPPKLFKSRLKGEWKAP